MPEKSLTEKSRTLPKGLRVVAGFFVATICGLAFGFTAMGFLLSMLSPEVVGSRDFVAYWATGQQLAHHGNPYDADSLLRIERGAGLHAVDSPMFMRNPPSALPLVFPLGFLGLQAASILWSLLLLMCLGGSVYMVWLMHGSPGNRRYLLGYSFGPALICLLNGQTSLFALLGLVLFLRLHRARPFLAGVSLWLCALKPHLFLPFGVVLIAWVIVSRSYKVLAGAVVAIAASSMIAFIIDPMAWTQYLRMVQTSGIDRDRIPCVSYLLRLWLGPHSMWLQYLPAGLGCAWAAVYFWSRRDTWDWMKNGSPVMLVSILSAPYYWLYDHVLAIPALLHGAYATRSRSLLAVLALLTALIEIALFCNYWWPAPIYNWTLWAAPAWLIWYLVACANRTKNPDAPNSNWSSDS